METPQKPLRHHGKVAVRDERRTALRAFEHGYAELTALVIRRAPLFIVALIAVECASLAFISDLKILSPGVPGLRTTDSLATVLLALKPTDPYPGWIYNFASFPGDHKKILPYSLTLLWLITFRMMAAEQVLRRVRRAHLRSIAAVHGVFSLGLVALYDTTMLYGNEHGHWFGATGTGLFSAFQWLGTHEVGATTAVATILYRLSYTLNTAILFISGVFPLILLAYAVGPPVGRGSVWSTLQPRTRKQLRAWRLKASKWETSILALLTGLIGTAAFEWISMYLELGNMPASQFLVGCLVILILGVPTAILLIKYAVRSGVGAIPGVITLVALVPVATRADVLYRQFGRLAYEVSHDASDDRTDSQLEVAGRLIAYTGTTWLESAENMDATRVLWEGLRRLEGTGDSGADQILYLIWAVQLHRIESLCGRSVRNRSLMERAFAGLADSTARRLAVISVLPRHQAEVYEATSYGNASYDWMALASSHANPNWRWYGRLKSEVRRFNKEVGGTFVGRLGNESSELKMALIKDGGVLADSSTAARGVRRVLVAQLDSEAEVLHIEHLPPAARMVADYFRLCQASPVWLANRQRACRTTL
jgi:hypothetical protein